MLPNEGGAQPRERACVHGKRERESCCTARERSEARREKCGWGRARRKKEREAQSGVAREKQRKIGEGEVGQPKEESRVGAWNFHRTFENRNVLDNSAPASELVHWVSRGPESCGRFLCRHHTRDAGITCTLIAWFDRMGRDLLGLGKLKKGRNPGFLNIPQVLGTTTRPPLPRHPLIPLPSHLPSQHGLLLLPHLGCSDRTGVRSR